VCVCLCIYYIIYDVIYAFYVYLIRSIPVGRTYYVDSHTEIADIQCVLRAADGIRTRMATIFGELGKSFLLRIPFSRCYILTREFVF
jgi:hypothetical protein